MKKTNPSVFKETWRDKQIRSVDKDPLVGAERRLL